MLVGIFVGGRATRMGGRPKGLLMSPDGVPIVERTLSIVRALSLEPVLVGRASAYRHLGVETIDDAPSGTGPLGGVVALLRRARGSCAVAVACDMPFVSEPLLRALHDAADASVVAPRSDDRWEPLFARYDARAVLPLAEKNVATGVYSLQRLLDGAGAVELCVDDEARIALHDWDSPEDAR
jgi:molybdopterin-guanine dinucleotide biosynthesis protein A